MRAAGGDGMRHKCMPRKTGFLLSLWNSERTTPWSSRPNLLAEKLESYRRVKQFTASFKEGTISAFGYRECVYWEL